MTNKISDKDKKDWENFISNKESLPNKDDYIKKDLKKTFTFDLHGYSIEDANKKVKEIIEDCYSKGFSEILIITGKGYHSKVDENVYVSKNYSILKGAVPDFIKNNSDLMSKIIKIQEAEEKMGGKGALLIKLKNKF